MVEVQVVKDFSLLPNEIEFLIISYLDLEEIRNISLVCRLFNYYSKISSIWKNYANSLIKPMKFDLKKHSIIKYGPENLKWNKFCKILKKSIIIKDQTEFEKLKKKFGMSIFLYPGVYQLSNDDIPPMNIIGLENQTDVVLTGNSKKNLLLNFIFQGGRSSWGVLNVNIKENEIEHCNILENCYIKNLTISSNVENFNSHLVCISCNLRIENCIFDSKNVKATSINIYSEKSKCILKENLIRNSSKHGIYVGLKFFF